MWPVYGQPLIMRTIGSYLPATRPTTAASAIGAKGLSYTYEIILFTFFSICVGLGLGDEVVYVGFITALSWLVVFYITSIAFFRTDA